MLKDLRHDALESILGMLIGSSLFIYGFDAHDRNYQPGADRGGIFTTSDDGKDYAIHQYDFAKSQQKIEFMGYIMGTTGAAIFAFAAKQAWDQRKKKREDNTNQAFQRLRRGTGKKKVFGMALGLGLFIGGGNFHDLESKDRRQLLDFSETGPILADPPSNIPEHLSYVMGTAGAAIFALSVKHAWEGRKEQGSISMNIDQAFHRLRANLR